MAYFYSIHSNLNLLYTELEGFMRSEELIEANYEISTDPLFRPGMLELTDISRVTGTDFGFDGLSNHSKFSAKYYSASKRTESHMIAPSDLTYGLARVYASLLESKVPSLELHLHRSESDALAAMGRPERTVKELLSI